MPRLRENVTTNDLRRSYRFWGGVLSLSNEIGKIRHSTVTLLLTTITEVLTDAHMLSVVLLCQPPRRTADVRLRQLHHPPRRTGVFAESRACRQVNPRIHER